MYEGRWHRKAAKLTGHRPEFSFVTFAVCNGKISHKHATEKKITRFLVKGDFVC